MVLDRKWKQKVEKNFYQEEEQEEESLWQFLVKLMRSKIIALSRNEEFKKLLKEQKLTNKYVTIFFGFLKDKDKKKLNISFVTKKKIGNAVKRNKIKRRLKNIMNEAIKKISLKLEYSYLVIAKPTMLNNEYTIIKETLFRNLKSIN